MKLRSLIGTKAFYRQVLALMLPIMIQNGITNFVNMLDNVMVGRVDTASMTGVAIANQLLFVFNLCIFGALAGAGIFGVQYAGKGDHEGVRFSFRFRTMLGVVLTLAGMALFWFGGDALCRSYLQGEGDPAMAAASLDCARRYLRIMLIGLLPSTLAQCYGSTLRETGRPTLPMVAGIVAVSVNLCLNYVLIFGHFGAPKLGVAGAAIATVISRFAELSVVAIATHARPKRSPFIVGAFRSLRVPPRLAGQILWKGLPLMANETLWAASMATVSQLYSTKGLNVVPANNIAQTFFDLFSVGFGALGLSIGIYLGQKLGAGDAEGALADSRRLIAFSVAISTVIGAVYAVCAIFIPQFYQTDDAVRHLAMRMMQISALTMPLDAIANACYFTIRSGGNILLTLVFDSGFMWVCLVPTAAILCHLTALPILAVYALCQATYLLRCVLGIYFVRKGQWLRNIVNQLS